MKEVPLPEKTRLTLRSMMEARKLSHGKVAELSGLWKTTVTRVLTGERRLSLDSLQGFALALKCRPSDIIKAAERL